MTSLQTRIEQFQKMAAENPDDELGHFRLGQLYAEDGQHDKALACFIRTLEISPQFSKVYQLQGEAYLALGRLPEAIDIWTRGWKIADERGDKMPRDAMGKLLKDNGAPTPEPVRVVEEGPDTGFRCQRPTCLAGRGAKQLPRAPLPDALHERIYREICADCWNDWFRNFSVKVINELRLDLSSEYGQEEYDKYMYDFFGFELPAKG